MLCLGNIMVTSSAIRRGPFWHILEICLHTATYTKHVASIFKTVSAKFGLRSIAELFEAYASQIAYSVRKSRLDFFRLPPDLLGYQTRKECAEACFTAFTPMNILCDELGETENAHAFFNTHCVLIGKQPEEGIYSCFSDLVAFQISTFYYNKEADDEEARLNDEGYESPGEAARREELMGEIYGQFRPLCAGKDLHRLIEMNIDGIVAAVICFIGDFDCSDGGAILGALTSYASGNTDRVIRAFRSLMRFRGHGEFMVHEPKLPAFSTELVLKSLAWLSDKAPSTNNTGTIYHVLHSIFAAVNRSPLINEQLRLLTCLCVYVSIHYMHFKNVALLRVLLNGAANLLNQPVLVGFAQGILDWTFIHLRDLRCEAPQLSAILIRIGAAARDYCDSDVENTQLSGKRLKLWIESSLLSLSTVEEIRPRVVVALAAWPDSLPTELDNLRIDLTRTEVSTILDDPYLATYNFKIVRHLAKMTDDVTNSTEQFAKHDFWRLKDSIPISSYVDEEAVAFASLLVQNHGQIHSHAVDQQFGRSIVTRHQKFLVKDDKGRKSSRGSVKRPIVMSLLDLLADSDPKAVSMAYRTLRRIADTDPFDAVEYGSWPSTYRMDLNLLNWCPVSRTVRAEETIESISKPRFLDIGSNFAPWISETTVFLADVLSKRDRFYSHFVDILSNNETFAEQLLPVLVHRLLQLDFDDTGDKPEPKEHYKSHISTYFAELIERNETDVRCLLSIVNTVLHLRNFMPPATPDLLAYNKWLDLDFMRLSRCAIACGAYTTALLFLELAPDEDGTKLEQGEQILFDIYSHIEEPDGFYGIKSSDLEKLLLKRFQHEQQWGKAFHFNGARFEGEQGPASTHGVVEALYSFGFNKLAMSSLDSLGFEGMASERSVDLGYKLGWRTSTWDLPDLPAFDSPSATLYGALRAVHRERDMVAVDRLVKDSMWKELQRLRTLTNENLSEIRQVAQCLMCLGQVMQWRGGRMMLDLQQRQIDPKSEHWAHLHKISANFE